MNNNQKIMELGKQCYEVIFESPNKKYLTLSVATEIDGEDNPVDLLFVEGSDEGYLPKSRTELTIEREKCPFKFKQLCGQFDSLAIVSKDVFLKIMKGELPPTEYDFDDY